MNLEHKYGFREFQSKTENIRQNAQEFIKTCTKKGKKIAAFGAAAKGNVFLNYCGFNSNDIIFVGDDTPFKQGKFLPGSHIPVVGQEALDQYQPDFVIILPWNFRDEIVEKLGFIKKWGGKFITFIPSIEIS